ncbi:MAG TPA: MFS transporter [Bacteroidota bacterium]|jgi:predicted MFS family arabinose efflux permease
MKEEHSPQTPPAPISERTILLVLTSIQFTNILDFVIMMPLGPQLMRVFSISPQEFGFVVSAYTFSAGISGFLAAFFIDRFDRKKALLVLYSGFTVGTFLCSFAPTYLFLVGARIIAGTFGGILAATILAIVSDMVPYDRRGAAMGMIMTAFSLAQVGGVPIGLFLANHFSWHAPFVFLASSALICMLIGAWVLPPMRSHLQSVRHDSPFQTVKALLTDAAPQRAILFMGTLIFGGFAIFPYISPYMVSNAGRTELDLPYLYFFGGAATIISSRVVGKLADRFGKLRVFTYLAWASLLPVILMTNLPSVSLPVAIIVVTVFMVIVSGRAVPSLAMVTAAVHPERRGSFLSISACVQQLSAGVASLMGGFILGKSLGGGITNFGWVGLISCLTTVLCIFLAKGLRQVDSTPEATPAAEAAGIG